MILHSSLTLHTAHCTRHTASWTLRDCHCIYGSTSTCSKKTTIYYYTETHDYWFLYLCSFILIFHLFPFILVLSNSTAYTLGTFSYGFWSRTFSIFVQYSPRLRRVKTLKLSSPCLDLSFLSLHYTVHCTCYTAHCTLHTVHCTLSLRAETLILTL
jgi:hypothetical protein